LLPRRVVRVRASCDRENAGQGRRKRRSCRTTDSNHAHPVAPNLLERRFETKAPNEAWVGDVTYIPTGEGWLYLAVLLDLFSRRVVGWATSATNDRFLALAALDQALRSRRARPGLVHHTDLLSPSPTPATNTGPRSPNEASSRA
jgi:transposase InsO family protein